MFEFIAHASWECRSVDPTARLLYASAHLRTLSDNTPHPIIRSFDIEQTYHLGLDAIQITGHSLGMIHNVNGVAILQIWNWVDGRRMVVSFPALLIVRITWPINYGSTFPASRNEVS